VHPLENQFEFKKISRTIHAHETIKTKRFIQENKRRTRSQDTKQMRPGTSHPEPHCSSTLRLPSRRLARRDDGTGPKALTLKQSSATFTGTVAEIAIPRISALQLLRWPAAQPNSKSGQWGRPQCPGNQLALARVPVPPAIHPRELPVYRQPRRNHRSASLRKVQRFQ